MTCFFCFFRAAAPKQNRSDIPRHDAAKAIVPLTLMLRSKFKEFQSINCYEKREDFSMLQLTASGWIDSFSPSPAVIDLADQNLPMPDRLRRVLDATNDLSGCVLVKNDATVTEVIASIESHFDGMIQVGSLCAKYPDSEKILWRWRHDLPGRYERPRFEAGSSSGGPSEISWRQLNVLFIGVFSGLTNLDKMDSADFDEVMDSYNQQGAKREFFEMKRLLRTHCVPASGVKEDGSLNEGDNVFYRPSGMTT